MWPCSVDSRWRAAQLLSLAVLVLHGAGGFVGAGEPLHARVDQLIAAEQVGPVATECSDAEYLRRVSLDLTGVIPTAAEARAYLSDKSPDKRAALVDRLLASPRYVRHMANAFDVMLMERRGDKHVKSPEWQKYLYDAMAANKPFDQLAREILTADGVDDKSRAAAKFYLDREGEPNLLTRDVGRIFFGRDFQCAQCHDHPLIEDYLQEDYYGIYAFLNRGSLFTDKKAKKSFYVEKAAGEVTFTSVFTEEKGHSGPRLPGAQEIDEPTFAKGQEYKPKGKGKGQPVPKFSRREQLSLLATNSGNLAFNRNIANRLWAHMMGRGLVHPLDLHHPQNPPSHPQVLALLASEFATMKYDVKALLRELALTGTYRRSFEMPADFAAAAPMAKSQIKTLFAEHEKRIAELEKVEKDVEAARETVNKAQEVVFGVESEKGKAEQALAAVQKASAAAAKALADSKKQSADKAKAVVVLNAALAKADVVVKQFPKDKELIAAAATYRNRAKKTTDEIAALKGTIEKQTIAAKTAGEKIAEPQRAVEAAAQKLAGVKQKLAGVNQTYFTQLYQHRGERMVAKHIENRLESARSLIAYNAAVATETASHQAVAAAQAALTQSQTARSQAETAVAAATSRLDAPTQLHARLAEQAAVVRKRFTVKQAFYKQVADAAQANQIALKAIPGDTDFQDSTKTLTEFSTRLKTELPPIQKLLAEHDTKTASAAKQLSELKQTAAAAQKAFAQAKQAADQADTQLKKSLAAAKANQAKTAMAHVKLIEHSTARHAVGTLKPLTPEQLSWSIMQASGLVAQQKVAVVAELDKKGKGKPQERTTQVEAALNEKLKANVGVFVKSFGAGAGQPQDEFFATVDQALFFANGGQIRGWLNPAGDNLTARLQKLEDPAAFAEELYLAVLTRRPTEAEITDVREYLTARDKKEKPAVAQELAWALFTSAEFRFSH